MPGFGKIKMTWKCAGENKLDVCETFEKLGTVQYKMTHCEKGSEWVSRNTTLQSMMNAHISKHRF